jgi:NADH-quinone oxidoreductase subunit H
LIDDILNFLDPYWWLIIGVVKAVIIAVGLLSTVPMLVWLERRLMGRFQVRLGPNRVGPLGLGQALADAIKLLFKENIVQSSADKFLFYLAPAVVVFTAIVTFSAIPFGEPFEVGGEEIGLWGANLNIGLLFIFAVSSMGIYGIVLAGLSSNNKYSLMGGLRSSAQMISYELTLGLLICTISLRIRVFGRMRFPCSQRLSCFLFPEWRKPTARRSICRKRSRNWSQDFLPSIRE